MCLGKINAREDDDWTLCTPWFSVLSSISQLVISSKNILAWLEESSSLNITYLKVESTSCCCCCTFSNSFICFLNPKYLTEEG